MLVTSSNKYLLNWQACRIPELMSCSRGRPSPGIVGIAEVMNSGCPSLLGWQGILAPILTARNPGCLCGNVKVKQAGTPHPALCSLDWVCACVRGYTCIRWGTMVWKTGARGPKQLSERI